MRFRDLLMPILLLFLILVVAIYEGNGCAIEADGIYEPPRYNFDKVLDDETGIVYIRNRVRGGSIFTPYFNSQGKLCTYRDGKYVSIEEDD